MRSKADETFVIVEKCIFGEALKIRVKKFKQNLSEKAPK